MSIVGEMYETFIENELQPQIDELKRQNAKLLAALKEIAEAKSKTPNYLSWLAREAIAKAGG